MTKIYNRATEKEKRRILRKNMPTAEVILWSKLKGRGLNGYKFRRQYSIEYFVLDFYCPKLKLAIEIDGESHFADSAKTRDEARQCIIEAYGIHFLRFSNYDIYENVDGVLEKINRYTKQEPPLPPP